MQLTLSSSITLLISFLAPAVLAQDSNFVGSDAVAQATSFDNSLDAAATAVQDHAVSAVEDALSRGDYAAATSLAKAAATSIANELEPAVTYLEAQATSLAQLYQSNGDAAAATSFLSQQNVYIDQFEAGISSFRKANPAAALSALVTGPATLTGTAAAASSTPTMTTKSTTQSTTQSTSPAKGTGSGSSSGGSAGGSGAPPGLIVPGAVALMAMAAGCAMLLL